MKPKPQERGQALILIVFAAVGFFALVALAIDGSRVFSDRRHAQNAADTSVLAAALAKIRGEPYADAAQARALSNGFQDGVNSTVEVKLCNDPTISLPCEGLAAGADPSEYIQVMIKLTTQTTFARILGRTEVNSTVTAIARVQGSSATGSSSSNAAMFATNSDPYERCFRMNGGANLGVSLHGSGFFLNCSSAETMTLGGNTTLQTDSNSEIVGCYVPGGSPNYDPNLIDCGVNGGVSLPIGASTFASVPTTLPPPTSCGSPRIFSPGGVNEPGSYTTITGGGVMNPGVYCVSGGILLTSGATLSAPNGTVQIVLQDQGITLLSGSTMDFADLEIYSNNAGVLIGGTGVTGAVLDADRLRYFSTGTGTVNLQGGATLTSDDAYFYLDQGNIDWQGNATLDLHGPPQGDQFGGLLIHKPWDNTSEVYLNGGANTNLTGTFMIPGSPVTLNGNLTFQLHSQLIASTFNITGSAIVDIFYDPTENYSPPDSPMIQLTK